MARIDVGIEPSDMAVCYQLFAGAEFESEVEGMLQFNALTPGDLVTEPLTPNRMQMWRRCREQVNASDCSSDAVGLVEFVNGTHHSITMPIHITKQALTYAQTATPFEYHSTLFGVSEILFSAMGCLEYMNSIIRSDSKNLFQLRLPMTTADKEIIQDAGRGEDRDAAEIFRLKVARENAYRLSRDGQIWRFTDDLRDS